MQRFLSHSRSFVRTLWILGAWALLQPTTLAAQPSEPVGDAAVGQSTVDTFDGDQVVAEVDGRSLTLRELMMRYATLPPEVRSRYGSRLDVFLEDVVSNLLVTAEAERLRVEEDPLFKTLMQIHREQVLRDLYARRTVLSQVDRATVERRYGEQESSRFERRPRVWVRHILVTPVAESRPYHSEGEDAVGEEAARLKIKTLQRRLATEEITFESLAEQASEDVSAPQGGDLGWVEPSELDGTLAKAVQRLPVGEVSEVVTSALGFHLVKVVDRRPAGRIPLDVVYELLYQEIVGEQMPFLGPAAEEDRRRLMEEGDVRLFPERLPW